jgi:TRAP-type C4-dicarboxylate transport system permease small subunit
MFSTAGPEDESGPALRFVLRVSTGLALLGGVLMLGLALLVTASVLLRWTTSRGLPGDFELAQMGMSVAIFAFLPFCQLRGSNIFVDTFTAWAPRRFRAALDALWALVYAVIAGLICWEMFLGGWETVVSATTTMVLGLPLGWAIVVAAFLSAWLTLVVVVTVVRALAKSRA